MQALPDKLVDRVQSTKKIVLDNMELYKKHNKYKKNIIGQLNYCLALSDYLKQYIFSNPQEVANLLGFLDLSSDKQGDYFSKENLGLILESVLLNNTNMQLSQNSLRKFRNQVMTRILLLDLLDISDFSATSKYLSDFADTCICYALKWLYKKYNQDLLVICLGKLGQQELNYSSDIDLVFCNIDSNISNISGEIFNNMAKDLIALLSYVNEFGFVFRVDMRLRPFGNSSALTIGYKKFFDYLSSDARPWERYVFMKARVLSRVLSSDLADNLNIKKTSEQVCLKINNFVFRRYHDFTVKKTILQMKKRIEHNLLDKKKEHNNFKLGPGGIRDIEFICQTFQLIYAAERVKYRHASTLELLDMLVADKIISKSDYKLLSKAYIFLRDSENHLQMINNQQQHQCPSGEVAQMQLSCSMNFNNWEDYYKTLLSYMRQVSKCFELLVAPQLGDDVDRIIDADILEEQNQENSNKEAFSLVITNNARYKSMDFVQQRQIQKIYVYYIQSCKDLGVQGIKLASFRFARLLLAIISRPTYLDLMSSNKLVISSLANYLAKSLWVNVLLIRMPFLLVDVLLVDVFLGDDCNYIDEKQELFDNDLYHSKQKLGDLLEQKLNLLGGDQHNAEIFNEAIRHFKWSGVLKIVLAYLDEKINLTQVSCYLTNLAIVIIQKVASFCWEDLVVKFNLNSRYRSFANSGFAIIAYGKLGSQEMLLASDLDLVFLYQESSYSQLDRNIYVKLAQKVLNMLQTNTLSGFLYQVDIRLRPLGGSGLLVSRLDSFKEYQVSKAWSWEHQALSRASAVAGDKRVIDLFAQVKLDVLSKYQQNIVLQEKLAADISQMRVKIAKTKLKSKNIINTSNQRFNLDYIKYAPGGLNDIEFLVQYLDILLPNIKFDNIIDVFSYVKSNLDFIFSKLNINNLEILVKAYKCYHMVISDQYLSYGSFDKLGINHDYLDLGVNNKLELYQQPLIKQAKLVNSYLSQVSVIIDGVFNNIGDN